MTTAGLSGLIVRKDDIYLVGTIMYSMDLRWSRSPWDAWRTRDAQNAIRVARRVGGSLVFFNPITGEMTGGRNSVVLRKDSRRVG